MTVENFNDLVNKRYLQSSEPTPFQIQKQLSKQQFLNNLSLETGIENISILETVFHPDGRANLFKINNFKTSLGEFIEKYSNAPEMLKMIDGRCFRENGRIIEKRLRKIYKKNNIS